MSTHVLWDVCQLNFLINKESFYRVCLHFYVTSLMINLQDNAELARLRYSTWIYCIRH